MVQVDEGNAVVLEDLWTDLGLLAGKDTVLVLDRADIVNDVDLGRRLHDLQGEKAGLRVIVAVRHAGFFWPCGLALSPRTAREVLHTPAATRQ